MRGGRRMYNNILVAYDGSKGSQEALDHAAELAQFHHSTLFIVHAMEENRTVTSIPVYGDILIDGFGRRKIGTTTIERSNYDSSSDKDKGAFLLHQARNNLSLDHSQIKVKILHGNPAVVICDFAKTRNVDLIVIGNRGLHGLQKIRLGSVSEKVAQMAPCPVLILK